MPKLKQLTEQISTPEFQVDAEAEMVRGMVLLGNMSPSKGRTYTPEAMRSAVSLFEGARYFIDAADELAFQKAMFDVFASASLSSMVEAMTGPDEPPIAGGGDFAAWQTEQSRLDQDEFRTFDEAFWIELCGALSVLIPEIYQSLVYVHRKLTQSSLPEHDGTTARHALGLFRRWLRTVCREQKLPVLLPSLHVTSGIHAAIRYQNRPHDKGDLHDQLHASVAVAYCTIFCTDRKLANLLTDSLLGYDELFSCQILGNDEGNRSRVVRKTPWVVGRPCASCKSPLHVRRLDYHR